MERVCFYNPGARTGHAWRWSDGPENIPTGLWPSQFTSSKQRQSQTTVIDALPIPSVRILCSKVVCCKSWAIRWSCSQWRRNIKHGGSRAPPFWEMARHQGHKRCFPGPLCSRLRPDVRDRQKDRQMSDRRQTRIIA